MSEIITRFAPSPTGYLHIGGARTALFNYLFAKANGGKCLLRIEDTDQKRQNDQAVIAIFEGLKWLGIIFDDEVIYQSDRNELYQKVAQQLIEKGKAYYCFEPQERINELRETAISKKENFIYRSPWRNKDTEDYPKDIKPVVRLKAPGSGETVIDDQGQGRVVVSNSHLDDMILLRSDGSATYMLAVVVDDHDMGITHIIRGDDHLNNAFRQKLIYDAMGWNVPVMAHIPLIHDASGAKLSKRLGAVSVEYYEQMGILPETLFNYLLRLGWSHGDDEIISKNQAIQWFGFEGLGKAPARIDLAKLKNLNAHYMRLIDENELFDILITKLKGQFNLTEYESGFVRRAMSMLKSRSQTIEELGKLAQIFLVNLNLLIEPEAQSLINNCDKELIYHFIQGLSRYDGEFEKDEINLFFKEFITTHNIKLPDIMKPIRAMLTGMSNSPSIFEIMTIIGKENTLKRLEAATRLLA